MRLELKPCWKFLFTVVLNAVFPFGLSAVSLSVDVQAKSAILMNGSTGAILYEKNAHQFFYPASITKIATAIYALEIAGNTLSKVIPATQEAVGAVSEEAKQKSNYTLPSYWLVHDASHMGIKVGEEFSLTDLLFGLMVVSADDAANVIALSLGGTIPNFMSQLNAYMRKLGCNRTNFNNPHGLFHPNHVTTAYDMALLTRHALRNPEFRQIVAMPRWVRPKTNKQAATVLLQKNKLLRKGKCYYPKAIGVKTGFHSKARSTLVAAAVDGDRLLIAVLLKCENREQMFLDAIKLFEAAFNQPKVERLLLKAGETSYLFSPPGAENSIKTTITENVVIQFYPSEEPELTATLQWKEVHLPVEKGQCVGEITIRTADNKVLRKVLLLAAESASGTWSYWFKSLFFR